MVDRADVGVVDIQQQAAAGALHDRGKKLTLVQCRRGEGDIGTGVFQQQPATEPFLDLVDMVADPAESGAVARDGQPVVGECPAPRVCLDIAIGRESRT